MRADKSNKNIRRSYSRAFSSGTFSAAMAFAAVAAVVVLNLLVSMLPSHITKLDTSDDGLYNIGATTKACLDEITDDVTIYLIAETGDEDNSLDEFLQRYESYSPHVKLKYIDPVLQPSFVGGYTSDTVTSNSLIVVSEKRYTVVNYEEIYTYDYEYDSSTEQYTITSIYFAGENAVTSAIKYVTTDVLPIVAFTSGHGEAELSDTYVAYLNRENIAIEYVTLLSLGSVPDDVDCLVICAPTVDFNAEEAQIVVAYLERGGDLVLLTDYDGTQRPNLLYITEYYGLTTSQGVVFDGNPNYYYKYEYYLFPDIAEHSITQPLLDLGYPVAFLYTHEIHTTSLYRDTIDIIPLLYTSDSSWAKNLTSEDESYAQQDGDPTGSFDIAVLAQEEHDDVLTRIVWYGSSSIVNDSADTLVSGANSDLFINTLAYLCDYESAISIHAKDITVSTLALTSAQVTFWTVVCTLVVPLITLLAGLGVWLKRRAA